MDITVLFFASCADIVGSREKIVSIAEGSRLSDLVDKLVASHGRLADVRRSAMLSLNQEYAEENAPLSDGDEVAMIPPVSGG